MYAHQNTQEPGSAFFGAFGTVPGDPGASLLLRTVNFFALNNIFVPNNTTTVAVRYGYNRFYDNGGNYPAFDAATLGLPAELRQRADLQHVPGGAIIAGYGGTATVGNVGPSNITHTTQTANATVSKLVGHHTLKFGGEYRRIARRRDSVRRLGRDVQLHAGLTRRRQPDAASTIAGDAFASFLLGYPASGSIVYGHARPTT